MKRCTAIALACLMLTACAKNLDNVPALSLAQEQGVGWLQEKLAGYDRDALLEIWGEPDGSLSGMWGDIWAIESGAEDSVIVYYDADGKVETVKLFVKPEVDTVTVSGIDGEPVSLLEEDAAYVAGLLEDSTWDGKGTTDCMHDYIVTVNGMQFMYHAACGTFNDSEHERNLPLEGEAQEKVNAILGRYVTIPTVVDLLALEQPPELTVLCGFEQAQTASPGYTWVRPMPTGETASLVACGAHPLQMKENLTVLQTPEKTALLQFEVEPEELYVHAWDDNNWGNTEVPSQLVTLREGGEIELLPGGYLYEVTAKWGDGETSGGTGSYVFYIDKLYPGNE